MLIKSGWPTRRVPIVAGWALLVFVALFWRLGSATFWDPDEAHYAVTTRELLDSSDWLVPTYNGQPFFDKPILFHLLQAGSMQLFGISELGARALTAAAALGLILVTFWLAGSLVNKRIGVVAALLLASSPALVALARYAILDAVFTLFLFAAASLLAVAALEQRDHLQWAGYVLLALAVLTKGPVALALIGLTFCLAVIVSRSLRAKLLALHWVVGAVLACALAAPWFIYMYERFGTSFVQGYVLNENLLLFSRPPYGNQPGWTFYIGIILVGMLPWTPVLLGRLLDNGIRTIDGGTADDTEILLWCWVTAVVVFFSASQFKLDHYVFPAAPALHFLCARAWFDATLRPSDATHRCVRLGLHCVGPVLVVAAVALAVVLMRLALPAWTWMLPVAWLLHGASQCWPTSDRQRRQAPTVTALALVSST